MSTMPILYIFYHPSKTWWMELQKKELRLRYFSYRSVNKPVLYSHQLAISFFLHIVSTKNLSQLIYMLNSSIIKGYFKCFLLISGIFQLLSACYFVRYYIHLNTACIRRITKFQRKIWYTKMSIMTSKLPGVFL